MATSGRGTGIVGYNVQTAVETKHHLIVAHEVTNVNDAYPPVRFSATLANDFVVLGMGPDPEPGDSSFDRDAERAVVKTDADGMKFTDTL